ncbi:hypothetical protein AST12_04775 [Staphylococcus succinus]|nr:hypothetical protein AST12_04775 [Staphylococcus succinus]
MKKVIMICVIITIITTIIIFCSIHFKTQLSSTNPSIETIKITYNKPFIFVGKKVPAKIASIVYDKNKGYINDWFVKANDKIKKNQVLFEYYNPLIEQQITTKQKQLFYLKQNKGSHLNLLKQEMLKLQADIEQLKNQLRTKVYAPETGTIYMNNNSPSQNEDIILYIYNSKMLIKAAVPESIIESLHLKDTVTIRHSTQKTFSGVIDYIAKLPINFHKNLKYSRYLVEIISQNNLPIGKHVKIEVPNHMIELPKSTIYHGQFVFIRKNNKFIKRVIKTKNMGNKEHVTIVDGLKPGDIVVKNADIMRSKN